MRICLTRFKSRGELWIDISYGNYSHVIVTVMMLMTQQKGQTALHLAAENDHSDVVKMLLKSKPDLVVSANSVSWLSSDVIIMLIIIVVVVITITIIIIIITIIIIIIITIIMLIIIIIITTIIKIIVNSKNIN